LIKSLCLRKEHTAQKLLKELEQAKSSEAAKKLQTLVYLTGVQGAADHELRVLRKMWSCWYKVTARWGIAILHVMLTVAHFRVLRIPVLRFQRPCISFPGNSSHLIENTIWHVGRCVSKAVVTTTI